MISILPCIRDRPHLFVKVGLLGCAESAICKKKIKIYTYLTISVVIVVIVLLSVAGLLLEKIQ